MSVFIQTGHVWNSSGKSYNSVHRIGAYLLGESDGSVVCSGSTFFGIAVAAPLTGLCSMRFQIPKSLNSTEISKLFSDHDRHYMGCEYLVMSLTVGFSIRDAHDYSRRPDLGPLLLVVSTLWATLSYFTS